MINLKEDQPSRMALQLYNTLTKSVEPFVSLKKNEVSIYVCGITPYDTTHLGHAFTYISFDALVRYLKFLGYSVRYVQNVTDIDDDVLKRAKETNQNWQELGKLWTEKFLSDMKALNWIVPDPYARATDSIPTIVKVVSGLIKKGFAYEVRGTVYFEVSKFKNYGKLSDFPRETMIRLSRARGANPDDPAKRDALDFILWQKTRDGEPFWGSPWGKGRPGWHIECSSMIYDHLGERIDPDSIGIDIHGGGDDLIYPHHESEIAQSESFTGKSPFARFFLHTGGVYYKSEKMSKSVGNLVMVSDLLKKCSANAIRWEILSHHFQEQWEFKDSDLDECSSKYGVLEQMIKNSSNENLEPDPEFLEALNDNLNTPKALEFLVRNKPKSLKSSLLLLGFEF